MPQAHDLRGNKVAQIDRLGRSTKMVYDAVKRLTNEDVVHQGTGSNRSSQWLYDAVGNRTLTRAIGTLALQAGSFVYDANDRLISESKNGVAITYTHDANGNQLTKTQAGAVVSVFRWDEENRLIGSTLGSGPTQKVVSYSYDPNGIRRAQEEVSGGIRKRTEYLVDPNQSYAQVLEEWTASGASSTALPDQTLAKSYVFGDDLISQTIAATTSFYHYDGLGTTRALSNSAGVVTDRYAYSAFGEEDPAGSWNAISTDNTYRYTGEQLDPNLGFYYLRARYMDPSRGGFVGMDSYLGSSQDPQSLHKYLYAHANPVMGTDPSGNVTLGEVMIAQTHLMTRAFAVVNLIHKVQTTLSLVQTLWQIGLVMDQATLLAANQHSSTLAGDADFINFLTNDTAEAVTAFRRNLSRLFSMTNARHSADIRSTLTGKSSSNGREKGFLIYLPTPAGVPNAVRAFLTLGRISAGRYSVPLKGLIGGAKSHKGRIVGAGSYTGKDDFQYFRMDYHGGGHSGSSGPDHWNDGKFHFHSTPKS